MSKWGCNFCEGIAQYVGTPRHTTSIAITGSDHFHPTLLSAAWGHHTPILDSSWSWKNFHKVQIIIFPKKQQIKSTNKVVQSLEDRIKGWICETGAVGKLLPRRTAFTGRKWTSILYFHCFSKVPCYTKADISVKISEFSLSYSLLLLLFCIINYWINCVCVVELIGQNAQVTKVIQ